MTINDPADKDVDFTDLLANGQAVGRSDGVVIFCFGPLPGERARVRIVQTKPKYVVAQLVELLRESPQRAVPFCPVFGICGGCQVQHLSYDAQLAWKRDVVRNALTRIGGLAGVEVAEPIGMRNPRAYRNKMSLVVDGSRDKVGFYKQRSHEIVEIDGCPIVMPHLDEKIPQLNGLLAHADTRAVLKDVRHAVARTSRSTGETILSLTTGRPSQALKENSGKLMAALPSLSGMNNSYDLSSTNAILGRKREKLAGSDSIEEEIAGVRYRVSAGSFFQINVEIVERICEFILRQAQGWFDRLTMTPEVVDLYSGAGTFSLYFAKLGAVVLGLEESRHAVLEARANAELNGLQDRASFQAGRVEQLVRRPDIRRNLAAADLVFLDPPRKGSDQVTLSTLAEAKTRGIWYLSCDPATLARDLKFLTAKGYRLDTVQPFDMFPQTGHVETLAMLHHV